MSLHTDLQDYLKTTFLAICPGGVFHEMYPQNQAVWPVLVYNQVSDVEIAGDMDYPTGGKIQQARYQLDVYGELSEQAITAGNTIKATLSALSGAMGDTTVQRVEIASASDLGERFGDKRRRRKSLDFVIFYS